MQLASTLSPIAAQRARQLLGIETTRATVAQRFALNLAAADPNAVVTYGVANGYPTCTATGADNAAVINAHDAMCAALGLTALLPPGHYVVRDQVTLTANWVFEGTLYVANNDYSNITNSALNQAKIIVTGTVISPLDLATVKTWGNTVRGSTQITGLTGRRGQYITVDTGDQYLLSRTKNGQGVYRTATRMGEGFYVIDNDGRLLHPLYGTWLKDLWNGANLQAEVVQPRITLEGLKVIVTTDGSGSNAGTIVSTTRSQVTFNGDSIVNLSNKPINQMHEANCVFGIVHNDSYVNGAQVVSTNYGFNSTLSCGITYNRVTQLFCRRGVDAHKGKFIYINDSALGDGWGAHYAWFMGSTNCAISATTAANPQCVQITGGNFFVRGGSLSATGGAYAAVAIREDGMEMGGTIVVEHVSVHFGGAGRTYFLFDNTGPNGDYADWKDGKTASTRLIEFPRSVTFKNCPVTCVDATYGVCLVSWLRTGWTDTGVPLRWINGTEIDIDNCPVKYVDPATGAQLTDLGGDGLPKTALYINKPLQLVTGITKLRVRRQPSLHLSNLCSQHALNTNARINAEFLEIDGDVMCSHTPGSYKEVVADCKGTLTSRRYPGYFTSWPFYGDEVVTRAPGQWQDYTPTVAANGGAGVTLTTVRARYTRRAKQLIVTGKVRLQSSTSPVSITVSLPSGMRCSGDNSGPAYYPSTTGPRALHAFARHGTGIQVWSLYAPENGEVRKLVDEPDVTIDFTIELALQ